MIESDLGGAADVGDDLATRVQEEIASVDGVNVIMVDAAACAALGCRDSNSQLLRVEVRGGRVRTLCPEHARAFVREGQ